MGWDSNPREACTPAGFQDRCLKPLGHPSKYLKREEVFESSSGPYRLLLPNLLSNSFRRPYFTATKRRIEASRRVLLHGLSDVAVQIHGDADCRMPKPLLRDLRMHAG